MFGRSDSYSKFLRSTGSGEVGPMAFGRGSLITPRPRGARPPMLEPPVPTLQQIEDCKRARLAQQKDTDADKEMDKENDGDEGKEQDEDNDKDKAKNEDENKDKGEDKDRKKDENKDLWLESTKANRY